MVNHCTSTNETVFQGNKWESTCGKKMRLRNYNLIQRFTPSHLSYHKSVLTLCELMLFIGKLPQGDWARLGKYHEGELLKLKIKLPVLPDRACDQWCCMQCPLSTLKKDNDGLSGHRASVNPQIKKHLRAKELILLTTPYFQQQNSVVFLVVQQAATTQGL